ncbi:Dienelactone hydrolase [Chitinophaga costaii]|uniref:Dienelactone hydrolase n=1 Tax=Chitinophaga costaii TaxID=1335309 RepID=A0A1C4G2F6_9BACT|nr:dienelactone hydrolase family protein [Chitinophaga costaii]PUZ19780.1 dienelactone hydrolase family protein [Chitinophaga costaii]SCC62336.1 Dienelactone hydrolase [Chitinophaga costaii]
MLKILALAALVGVGGAAAAQGNELIYTSGDATLKGYFVKAASGKGKAPGVVVLPAWLGLNAFAKSVADKLGAMGYNALAADIYGNGELLSDMATAAERSGYYKKNYAIYQRRIQAAIDALVRQGADPARIVVMGYCFGGTGALEAVRGGLPVKGIVTFHGGLARDTTRPITPITAKVLVLHAAADQTMTDADVLSFQHEMRDSKADWQMIYYADAQHGFTEPGSKVYNESAARRSWQHMQLFLKEVFGE